MTKTPDIRYHDDTCEYKIEILSRSQRVIDRYKNMWALESSESKCRSICNKITKLKRHNVSSKEDIEAINYLLNSLEQIVDVQLKNLR